MENEKLFYARLDDFIDRCGRGQTAATAFLTPEEIVLADAYLRMNARDVSWTFCGGAPDAERRILIIRPDYLPEDGEEIRERISALEIKSSGFGKAPDHRAYLGSLMALGIKRETVGDILCMEDCAVVFVTPAVAAFLCADPSPLTFVGREKVRVLPADPSKIAGWKREFAEISIVVASMRLDCIVAELAKVSREKAKVAIQRGDVQRNHRETTEVSQICVRDDVLSIRGCGKFIIGEMGTTKKDRVRLSLRVYR